MSRLSNITKMHLWLVQSLQLEFKSGIFHDSNVGSSITDGFFSWEAEEDLEHAN